MSAVTVEDVQTVAEQWRTAGFQRRTMEPLHPEDYARIQRELGTEEPLTEHDVWRWVFLQLAL